MNTTAQPFDLDAVEAAAQQFEQTQHEQQETEAGDVKWLMGTRRGRRILWRQLERAGVFRSSFDTNAMRMAFTEGNRNVGLQLLALIQTVALENYTLMIREANDAAAKPTRR